MNKPVSFELAELLRHKGFDELCYASWEIKHTKEPTITKSISKPYKNSNHPVRKLIAPTIAEVVMWLYEKHGIWINVDCDCYGELWYTKLSIASENNWDNIDLRHEIISATKKFPNEHNSPTEAYEAAIEYCLENLVGKSK